jgi:uncharacterized protein involved in outer membrane biogenesis
MGKTIKIILLIVIVVVLAVWFGRNAAMKSIVSGLVKKSAGVDLKIGSLDAGIISSRVTATNVTVMSPPGFENEPLLKVSGLYAEYEWGPLLKGKLHLKRVNLDVREIVLVKDCRGRLNITEVRNALKRRRAEKSGKGNPKQGKKTNSGRDSFFIDEATVNLGRILYKDYSKGGKPKVSTVPLMISKATFRNVSGDDIASAASFLASAPESGGGKILRALGALSGAADEVKKSAEEAGASDALKGLGEALQGLAAGMQKK